MKNRQNLSVPRFPLPSLMSRGLRNTEDIQENNDNNEDDGTDDEISLKLPVTAPADRTFQRVEERTVRLKMAAEQELENLVTSIIETNELPYWEKNDELLRKVDGNGCTCFHWMVSKRASVQIIQEALKNFGEASSAMNKDQKMPIAMALSQRKPDFQVIKALVNSDNNCLDPCYRVVDVAVSSNIHPEVVHFLLCASPEPILGRNVNLLQYIVDVKVIHVVSEELIMKVIKKSPEDAFVVERGEEKLFQELAAYRLLAGWKGEQDCMQHRVFLHLYTYTLKKSTHKTVPHLLALLCFALRALHDDAPTKVTQLLDLLQAMPDFNPLESHIIHIAATHCRQLACFQIVFQRFPQCQDDILVTIEKTKPRERGPCGKGRLEVNFYSLLHTFLAAVGKWDAAADGEQDLIGIAHLLLSEPVVEAAEAAPFSGDATKKTDYEVVLKELLFSKTSEPSVWQKLTLRDRERLLQAAYNQILEDSPQLDLDPSAPPLFHNRSVPLCVKDPMFIELAKIALSPAELLCGVRYGSCALHLSLQFCLPNALVAYVFRAAPGCCELAVGTSVGTLEMALACQPPLSVDVIDRIARLAPHNYDGGTYKSNLLLLALKHGAPVEVVQLLFDAWPEEVLVKLDEDELPILYALLSPRYNVFLPDLMDMSSKQLAAKDCCVLHKAIKLGLYDVSTLQILLAEFPALAFVKNSNDEVPLAVAVSAKAPIATIQFLLAMESVDDEAEPVLCMQNHRNYLPLEMTFKDKNTPLELTSLLLPPNFSELKGRAEVEQYIGGFDVLLAPYTVRKAILAGVPLNVLDLLVETVPGVLQQPSTSGMLPLHYIFEEAGVFNKKVFDYVFAAFPGAVRVADSQLKRLPLHYAAKISTHGAVQSLIAEYPQACQVRDSDDLLPLHVALRYACHETQEDLLAIIDAYPQACALPSDSAAFTCKYPVLFVLDGERMCPIVCVEKIISLVPPILDVLLLKHSAKIDVEGGGRNLLRAVVKRRLQCNVSTGSIWHDIMDPKFEGVSVEVKALLVNDILSESPDLSQRLCHGRDINGREAINIVERPVREVMLLHTLFCGRFALSKGPVVHRSATSVVVQALDHAPADDWLVDFQRASEQESAPVGQLSFTGFFQAGLRLDLFAYEHPDLVVKNAKIALFDAKSERWLSGYVKTSAPSTVRELDPKVTVVLSSSEGGAAQDRVVSTSILRGPEIIDIAALFASIDHGRKGYLVEEEFLQACKERLGDTRRVVLKFMRNQEQYQREIDFRSQDDGVKSCVLKLLCPPDADLLAANLQTLKVGEYSLSEYRYCLVMPEADRNMDSIRRFERPDKELIRRYFRDIARTLGDLHENNIMHGDIKLLNAVRLKQQIQLIDLDAASSIGTGFAGAKFSSGVLPPELFVELTSTEREQYVAYWKKHVPDMDNGTLRKLLPVDVGQGKYIVVRTFHTDVGGNPVQVDAAGLPVGDDALPYTLIPASASVDAWSFGVMLFSMFARCPLLLVSDEDDLVPIMLSSASGGNNRGHKKVDVQPMQIAKEWTKEAITDQLQIVEDAAARELLGLLLDPNPATRLNSMRTVLKHRFFDADASSEGLVLAKLSQMSFDVKSVSGAVGDLSAKADTTHRMLHEAQITLNGVLAGVVRLETLSKDMCVRLESTKNTLLKAVIEANDVVVPSCFVIVNQKLQSLTETEVESSEPTSVELVAKRLSNAERWVGKISSFFDAVSRPSALIEAAQQMMMDMFTGETLYLYLVDEATMLPYVPQGDEYDSYPIPITTTADSAAQLVPLLKISMTAISIVNTASGLARCLGYPTPFVPDSVTGALQKSFHQLDEKTSIAEFDKLQSLALKSATSSVAGGAPAATSGNGDPNTVRGQALRQLEALIAAHDPAKTLCGLRRVIPPGGDGSVLWTTEEGLAQLVKGSVRGLSVEMGCQTEVTEMQQTDSSSPSPIKAVVPVNIGTRPTSSSAKSRSTSAKSPSTTTVTPAAPIVHSNSVSSPTSSKSSKFGSTASTVKDDNEDEVCAEEGDEWDDDLGTEGRPSVHAETYQQMKDYILTQQPGTGSAAVVEQPSMVLRFETGIFHIDVCINVIFQAATLVFGSLQHNIARPRLLLNKFSFFGRKINLSREFAAQAGGSKMVSGAFVMQVMRKCMSTTGECLFYMFRLREWESLLKMETGLHALNRSRKN